MSIDIMKSNGTRCQPVLIGSLLVLCLYFVCSWWSLSSQSAELIKQLDNLAEDLKIIGDELSKCAQDRAMFDEKLKDSQNRYVQQQIKIEQVKESEDEVKENYEKVEMELQESKKKSESVEENLKMCQTEMESLKKLGVSKDKATEALRTENESLKSKIEQKDKQIKELEKQIKTFDKTSNLLSKDKILQSFAKNFKTNSIKNLPKTVNSKTEKEVKGFKDQQIEEKFDDRKNYGDSGLLSLDNDPREEEMKES